MKVKTRFLVSLVPVLTAATAFAQGSLTYSIKQVIPSHKLVIAEAKGNVSALSKDSVFLVTFPDRRQCSLPLLQVSGKLLKLDASDCDRVSQISTKLPLEASLLPVTSEAEEDHEEVLERPLSETRPPFLPELKQSFGLVGHWAFKGRAAFTGDHEINDSGARELETEFGMGPALGVGAVFAKMPNRSFGYSLGLHYESPRQIEDASGSWDDLGMTYSFSEAPKLSFLLAEALLTYRWDSFYLPFGMNVSFPALSDAPSGEEWKARGGLGFYGGLGHFFGPNLAGEFFLRTIGFELKVRDATNSVDFGTGSMANLGIAGKYYF